MLLETLNIIIAVIVALFVAAKIHVVNKSDTASLEERIFTFFVVLVTFWLTIKLV